MPEAPTPARASAFEWARTALLSANLAWTTLCLGGVLPSTRLVTFALTTVLVAVHFADPDRGRRGHPAGWLFVPFLAYAAANVAWVTPVRWVGWVDWLNWAQAGVVFWVVLNGIVSPGCRAALISTIVLLGGACGALALYQHFVRPDWIMLGRTQADQYIGRSSGLFGGPNSLGALMVLLLPPMGWLAFKGSRTAVRAACAAAFLLGAAGLVLSVSRGAWLGLLAALVVRPFVTPGRSAARRLGAAAASLALALAAGAAVYFAFPLMRDRLAQLVANAGERSRPIVWRGALRIFEGHPVLGAGAGAFDSSFEAFRPLGFRDQPVYAHCDYLNTLSDYGVVGFILAFGAAAVVARRISRLRGLGGAAFTGLLAFAFHLLVDFHFKIPSLAMISAAVAAVATAEAWPSAASGTGPARRAAALIFASAFAAASLAWALPMYRAEALRYTGRAKIDHMALHGVDIAEKPAELAEIRAAFSRAVEIDPRNGQAWSDKSYGDSLEALIDRTSTVQLGAQAVADADRAIALDPGMFEFWIRKGSGLDMERRWDEGGECFARALQIAPDRADVWYYQAYHLSLKPIETGPAMAAANLCLRLDPGFLLAQALRQRLSSRH